MMRVLFGALFLGTFCSCQNVKYEPNWKSLDSRPLPSWYDDAKFGIFVHWGVFSVPSFGSEWFWYDWQGPKPVQKFVDFMEKNYLPGFSYQNFAPMFTAQFFDPDFWAELFQSSGAKYVVLTSKHHEGWTNWGSKFSWNWNSVDNGPHRDLVGDLANSIRKNTNIHFGLYHSLYEWFNPLYLEDKNNSFATQKYVEMILMPELYEIINNYQPEILWSDGDWEAPDTYWNSTAFLVWLYNESPVRDVVVTDDRWGKGISCNHGGFFTCQDRYNPGVLKKHKWENAMTVDKQSWGFRREATLTEYLTTKEIIQTLTETVSCGGNLLMNIGPTHDGRILPVFEERLRDVGKWLALNGEAIYETHPWKLQNDSIAPGIWYTSKTSPDNSTIVYAILLNWPSKNNQVTLTKVGALANTTVSLVGQTVDLKWSPSQSDGMIITLPNLQPNLPEEYLSWGWVLKLLNLATFANVAK